MVWSLLNKSLGLLGKPFLIANTHEKFGEVPQYWAIQLEWPKDFDDEKKASEETVILLTPHELERALTRAKKNPEDIAAFLNAHSLADSID